MALATHDAAETHRFYTEVMGFELVKVVTAPTPGDHGGWSKHFFYSTGTSPSGEQGMMAFFELHDALIGREFEVDLNKAAGVPWWVNHIAFDAPTAESLTERREVWRRHGHTVAEIDHEFCRSIYIRDPAGNTVEFCHTLREFTDEERLKAHATVTSSVPNDDEPTAKVTVWEPLQPVGAG